MDKVLFFAVGYVLGTRAGRERYQDLLRLAGWVLGRDEVQTVLGLARAAIESNLERAQTGIRRAA